MPESGFRDELLDKIRKLPTEKLVEVEDFVDSLSWREQHTQIVQAAARGAEAAFHRVWDNPEDAIYDQL